MKRLLGLWLLTHTAFAAETGMRLTIPRTTHPPTLDGKLAPGEWDDAAAVTGIINQFDGVAHPRQATFWLKYDDKFVYVGQRSSLVAGERSRTPPPTRFYFYGGLNLALDRINVPELMPPLYFRDNQNTVVIALAPNRVNSGDTPSWYRFMANITSTNLVRRELCAQIRGLKLQSLSSGVDTLDVRKIPNTTRAGNSFNADQTVWESEYAIPLAEMNVTNAPAGEEWGILLARDYPQQDQNAIVQTETYRFDWVAREWRNQAVLCAYDAEKDYARVRLTDHAPIVQVLSLGEVWTEKLTPQVQLVNPTTTPVTLTVEANGQQSPVTLAAGERRTWTTTLTAKHELLLKVTNAAGTVLYAQRLPIRVGYGRDRTAFVPDVWFSGEPKLTAGKVIPLPVYNPIRNTLWVKVQVPGPKPPENQQQRATITVRRRGADKPFATYPMSTNVQGFGDYELHTTLPALKPGVYEVTASLYDATNSLVGRGRDLFLRYDHQKELPWLGNKVGVTDQVLPPWTPIETRKHGAELDLSCWSRTYRVAGSGFLSQVKDLDEDILSGPVRIEIRRDQQPVLLTAAKRLAHIRTAKNEAQFDGALTANGWKITTHGRLEYDGYLEYRLRFEPVGTQSVDRIQFIVPLTETAARYIHATASSPASMRGMRTTMALKKVRGQLWNSGEQVSGPGNNGNGLVVGNFKPYVWVGGVQRGLAFMADSDEGWVPDETKQVSAIVVVRTETGVSLVLNLVARPFRFTHAREITFSLQATPLKPLPDDFRFERFHVRLLSAFVGFDPDGWAWNGCQLALTNACYICGQSSSQYPLNWQKNLEWNTVGWQRTCPWQTNAVLTQYQALDAIFQVPELDDPRIPGLHGANLYGYLLPEITAHRDCYDGAMQQTEVEYRIWRYQKWIRAAKVPGWYFDNAFSGFGANPEAGMGYVLDLPDRPTLNGQIQPGYAWRGIREVLKRLRAVTVAEGIRPAICLHGTDTYVMGAYAFADYVLDGENGPWVGTNNVWFSEKWSPDYMQTLNDGAKWGLGTYMLDMFQSPLAPNPLGRDVVRDYLGYLNLHDNEASSCGYTDWRGLDRERKADFLPYWDAKVAAAIQTGATNVLASAWRQDNALRVVVFNRSGAPQTHLAITIDPMALGVTGSKGFVVSELQTRKPETNEATWLVDLNNPGVTALGSQNDGKLIRITLDIRPHDYRLMRVEAAK